MGEASLQAQLKELKTALWQRDNALKESKENEKKILLEFSREREKLNATISELSNNVAALTAQVQLLTDESSNRNNNKKRKNVSEKIVAVNKSNSIKIGIQSDASASNVGSSLNAARGVVEPNLIQQKSTERIPGQQQTTELMDTSDKSNAFSTDNNAHPDDDNDDPEECWNFVTHKNKSINHQKIPPIQVTFSQGGFGALHRLLHDNLGFNKFTINPKNNGLGARIYPANITQHDAISTLLLNRAYEFHSYLTNESKKKCFIIRGINSSFGIDCDHICDELVRAGFPESTSVVKHETGHMRANNGGVHLFKLIVPAAFDESIFKSTRSMFGIGVSFSKFVSNAVTQCSNCQAYFHTSAACNRKYRCVKCIGDHPRGECPKNNSPNSQPQCVNCSGFHTANNQKQCDYFNKTIQPIINKRTTKPANPTASTSNNSNKNKSNAILVNSTNRSSSKSNSSNSAAGGSYSAAVRSDNQTEFSQFFQLFSNMLSKQDKIIELLAKNGN